MDQKQQNKKQEKVLKVLKGNFAPRRPVEVEQAQDDLTTQFEREALKRLGGSIAFVSKKKFLYGMEKNRDTDPSKASNDKTATDS